MKRFILFDLDGTLSDPKVGITKSVQYALSQFGIEENADALTPFIGPPLRDSFMNFYGFSPPQAEEAVAHYRVYYEKQGMGENTLYPGIKPMLEALKEKEATLFLATSKPWAYAEQILKDFSIHSLFSFIGGSEMDGTRSDKAEVIAHVLHMAQLLGYMDTPDPAPCIMVGDRSHDILGAKKNHMDSIGVLFGYGDEEELTSAGATYIVDSVQALSILLSGPVVE
ncbi:HAD family hydrolase [Eubacteriales bacterium OttesenSCG-928-M02]|nr:HAD family hydrolase [Eubacteriales bacterium OttesenSCG-928-M02]